MSHSLEAAEQRRQNALQEKVYKAHRMSNGTHPHADENGADKNSGVWTATSKLELDAKMDQTRKAELASAAANDKFEHAAKSHEAHVREKVLTAQGLNNYNHEARQAELRAEAGKESGNWTPAAHLELEQRRQESHKRTASKEAIDEKLANAEKAREAHVREKVLTAQGLNCSHCGCTGACGAKNTEGGAWTPAAKLELEQRMSESAKNALTAEAIDEKLAKAEQARQNQLQSKVATAKGLNCYRHTEAADASCSDCGKWTPAARLELDQRMSESHKNNLTADAIDDKLAQAEKARQNQLQSKVATAQGLNCYRHADSADASCADCAGKWTPAARLELEQRMSESHKNELSAESLAAKAAHAETVRQAHVAAKVATAQGLNPTRAQ